MPRLRPGQVLPVVLPSLLAALLLGLTLFTTPAGRASSLPSEAVQPVASAPPPSSAPLSEQDTGVKLQGSRNVELVGQTGGTSYAVAVSGTLAYVGVSPRLVILNLAYPAHPAVIAQTSRLPTIVEGVAVAGSYAYVADGLGGLVILRFTGEPTPTPTHAPARTATPTLTATRTATGSPTATATAIAALPDLAVGYVHGSMRDDDGGCVSAYGELLLEVCVLSQGTVAPGPFSVRASGCIGTPSEWRITDMPAMAVRCHQTDQGVIWLAMCHVEVDVYNEVVEPTEANDVYSMLLPIPTPPPLCTATPTPTATPTAGVRHVYLPVVFAVH